VVKYKGNYLTLNIKNTVSYKPMKFSLFLKRDVGASKFLYFIIAKPASVGTVTHIMGY